MALVVTRLRYQPKGFRARMSDGWFVFDDVAHAPIAGPFDNKDRARKERDRMKGERHDRSEQAESIAAGITAGTDTAAESDATAAVDRRFGRIKLT